MYEFLDLFCQNLLWNQRIVSDENALFAWKAFNNNTKLRLEKVAVSLRYVALNSFLKPLPCVVVCDVTNTEMKLLRDERDHAYRDVIGREGRDNYHCSQSLLLINWSSLNRWSAFCQTLDSSKH